VMISRYVCNVLDEMRYAIKNLNHLSLPISKRHLSSLIEEVQTAVNRMENALEARDSVEHYEERYTSLKEQIRQLKKTKRDLGEETDIDDITDRFF
jgi:outer membrane protein assembly factor BamD (BamD/ComL family)